VKLGQAILHQEAGGRVDAPAPRLDAAALLKEVQHNGYLRAWQFSQHVPQTIGRRSVNAAGVDRMADLFKHDARCPLNIVSAIGSCDTADERVSLDGELNVSVNTSHVSPPLPGRRKSAAANLGETGLIALGRDLAEDGRIIAN
jgi:hypothetical protein